MRTIAHPGQPYAARHCIADAQIRMGEDQLPTGVSLLEALCTLPDTRRSKRRGAVQRRQFFAEVNQVLIALGPIAEQREFVGDCRLRFLRGRFHREK